MITAAKGPALALCGDGRIDVGEVCDDGNQNNCDSCSSLCQVEPQGASWCFAGGPEGGSVYSLAVDRGNPPTFYAGTNAGLFKWSADTQAWRFVDIAVQKYIVRAVAVSPHDSAIILAGAEQHSALGVGIYRTADGGLTWNRVSNNTGLVYSITFDPSDSTIAYAGTQAGVFRSNDAGRTWNVVGNDYPGYAYSVAIDPVASNTVYAIYAASNEGGVKKSTDSGTTWSLGSGLPNAICTTSTACVLTIDPWNPLDVYLTAGLIYHSADGGSTWNQSPFANNPGIYRLVFDPAHIDTIYATCAIPNVNGAVAGSTGIFKSADGGQSWTPTGLADQAVGEVVFDSQGLLVAATSAGVFQLANTGQLWQPLNRGLYAATIIGFTVDPSTAGRIYANTDTAGVWVGEDYGTRWSALNNGLPLTACNDQPQLLIVDPLDPENLYLGRCQKVFRSTNRGYTWSGVAMPFSVYGLAIDFQNPAHLYASGLGVPGVFESMDGGMSWSPTGSGGPNGAFAITMDPSTPSTLYVSDIYELSVFKTTDAGQTWTSASNPRGRFFRLAVDPATPTTIYGAGDDLGVRKSLDGAATWVDVTASLPPRALDIVIDPNDSSILYAASLDSGIYGSTDQAETWQPVPGSLTNAITRAVGILAGTVEANLRTASDGDRRGSNSLGGGQNVQQTFLFAGTTTNGGVSGVFRKDLAPVEPTPTSTPSKTATPTSTPADCGDGVIDFGEQCDDGNAADGDCCSANCLLEVAGSRCGADDDLCSRDICDGAGLCTHPRQPHAACRTAGKSIFLVKNDVDDAQDRLVWKWLRGEPTTQQDFHDPTITTDYALCIYGGAASKVIARAAVSANVSKWSAIGIKGYRYDDPTAAADGIQKVLLKGGSSDRRSKIIIKGKGVRLPDFLPATAPITVQLINGDNGQCWQASYAGAQLSESDGVELKAKAP